jgi:hypothetical protein
VQAGVQAVQANVQQVVTDAKAQYEPQLDRLSQDAGTLRSAADSAVADPSMSSLSAVGQAIRTLADDVGALADVVTPSC